MTKRAIIDTLNASLKTALVDYQDETGGRFDYRNGTDQIPPDATTEGWAAYGACRLASDLLDEIES